MVEKIKMAECERKPVTKKRKLNEKEGKEKERKKIRTRTGKDVKNSGIWEKNL